MKLRPLLLLFTLALGACGGGTGSTPYQDAVDRAAQQEAQARMLGVVSPCEQNSQCGMLSFLEPGACPTWRYQIYSLASATAAAASAAAAQEVSTAQQAIALLPPPTSPCLLAVLQPPVPVCVANKCQASF